MECVLLQQSEPLRFISAITHTLSSLFLFFLRIIYLFILERGREGEREEEKHQCVVASCTSLTGDQACALDWESNRHPFDFQAGTQSTEPHQLGHYFLSA